MPDDLLVKHINGERALPLGSRPPPLEHQFLDENGDPFDISIGTWTGQGRAEKISLDEGESQPADIGTGGVVVDVPSATATYTWVDEDFGTVGRYRIIVWIGNGGTARFGSTTYEWDVSDAPGADPTV